MHLRESFDSTEDAIALQFSRFHPNLLWCQVWGKWLIWSGTVWTLDQTVHVYDQVRAFCRNSSEWIAESPADKKKFCSAAFIAAVEKLCKSDRRYAAKPDQFDADDWIINTPLGSVDLRSGVMAVSNPDSFCTKITAVGPEHDCHRWREFLGEVTDYDSDLIDYLQRIVGYCLTGSTREHALFFLYGTGGNGKSVFLDTLTGILGNYARTAPMEVFTESRTDRHPTELAMLQGARLVVANETEQGKRWAQSRIKGLTGGDTITARFMRQDFFEYKPKFKLVFAGNAKPKLDIVDEAMRRRFHIIPFTVQIPMEDRDRDLAEKLRIEWSGIFAWAIEGCLQYQLHGLAPSARVIEATKSYLESQDVFTEWRESECELGPDYWVSPTNLFTSWRQFAETSKEHVGTRRELKERLEAAGFRQKRDGDKGRYWTGIRAKSPETRSAM